MNRLGKLAAMCVFLSYCASSYAQDASGRAVQITAALREGKADWAVQLADQGLAASPNDPQIWTLKAIALLAQRRTKEALAAYHHALRLSPNYLAALEGAAQIHYAAGDKEALTLLQRIAQLRPTDQTSHAMLGALAYKQGNCSDAVAEFEKGRELMATQPGALQQYGACLVRLRQVDKAIAVFQQLLASHPEDLRARRALASVQFAGSPERSAGYVAFFSVPSTRIFHCQA